MRQFIFAAFLVLAPLAARAQVVANPTTLAQFCVDRTVTPWVIGHSRKDGKCIAAMTQDPATGVTTLVPSALLIAPPTTGVPAADGAQDTTQNSAVSALNIYTPITAGGFFYYDTKRDVTVVPPNSTAINTSSHACYLLDNSATSTMTINGASQLVGAGVCDWGAIIAGVDGSAVWGKAHYLSDTATNGAPPRNSTGRTIVADEEDFQGNALDSSGNPATTAAGTHLLFGGVYKNATGFTVGSRGARNVDEAFTVADGTMKPGAFSTINGIDGSPTGTASIGSQVHRDDWYDGTQRQTWQHAVQADGGYIWNPSVPGKPFRINSPLAVTGGVQFSSTLTLGATPLGPFIADTNPLRGYGYVGDGSSHPLSSVAAYAGKNTTGWSLAQWQTILPAATALTDEIDWVAIQSVFNSQNGAKSLVIPQNTRGVLNHQITCDPLNTCSISGSGRGSSQLLFTNANSGQAGILHAPASEDKWLRVHDVAVMTNVNQPANAGISYQLTGDVLGIAKTVDIKNTFVGGTSLVYPYNNYWNVGIDTLNASFGEISSNFVVGLGNSTTSLANAITTNNMLVGIRAAGGSASPTTADETQVNRNLVFQAQTGIALTGDAEFPRVESNSLEGVNIGVSHISPPGGAATMNMSGNYISAFVTGLQITNASLGDVRDNIFALVPPANTTASGVVLSAVNYVKFHHNTIVGYGPGNSGTAFDTGSATYAGLSFDDNDCLSVTACFDTHASTSGGAKYINNTHVNGGVSTFDLNPSPTVIYTNNHNLPAADQLPTLTPNSTTPNASFPSSFIRANSTTAVTVASFANGPYDGPEFTVWCREALTSFANSATLYTLTGGTVTCSSGKMLKFKPVGQGNLVIQTQ